MSTNYNPDQFEKTVGLIADLMLHNTKGRKIFLDELETVKSIEQIKHTVSAMVKTYFDSTGLLLALALSQSIINRDLLKIVTDHPNKEELDRLETDLNNRVRETLEPMKRMLDEAKKREENGDHIYG